ncbi:MAG: SIS domain-containing protein [Alphaproteobacteria bacterium]|nr:SIS domain-containing protein [Alphaproteobacteria bacterium]
MSDAAAMAAGFLAGARNLEALARQAAEVLAAAEAIVGRMRAGGKVMFCGNGGSAADAQHLAAELQGRYLRERRALAALALTTDSSAVTAIGNDYGFADIFARQLAGLAGGGDVLVAISTSGESENVLRAAACARKLGLLLVGLTGRAGGRLAPLCDHAIRVPADETPRIQELHIAVGHAICGHIETALG